MAENIDVSIERKTRSRLRLLIISRVIIITMFLSATIFIDIIKTGFSVSVKTLSILYMIIAATYFFSIIYILLLRSFRESKVNIYLQLSLDVIIVTLLVYITGSLHSNYSVLYTLVIIYSVIFLGRYGGLIIASASSIFYGLLLDFEFHHLIPSFSTVEYTYDLAAEDVFFRILVHIISFYILALLASFVVEQEKKTRFLLEERESAFNQLDILFRSIVESVDTGVMTTNMHGVIKTFNRAAEEITGFSLSDVKDRRISDIFPKFAAILSDEDVNKQIKNRIEVDFLGNKNKKIHLGCSVSILKDNNDKQIGRTLIFQDLTEIKQMEESLDKSRRLALIGEIAAGLAHEMRNPLTSITGSIELIRQGRNIEETDKRLIQIIYRGRDQLENFIRDFLLLSKPIPVVKELVDINEVIQEVIECSKLSEYWMEEIKLNTFFLEAPGILANREQIRQIINNLVLNAIQSMGDGGVLSISAQAMNYARTSGVEIKVSDTGHGIEEKHLQKIFEPFYTNKDKGTGLGLTIVARLVDGYGGKIKMESILNSGSTCTVWLPQSSNITV